MLAALLLDNFHDLADGDGATFVAHSHTPKSGEVLEDLHTGRAGHGQLGDAALAGAAERAADVLALVDDREQFSANDFNLHRVYVHDGLVAGCEERSVLQHIHKRELHFDFTDGRGDAHGLTQHVALLHVLHVHGELQHDVLARFGRSHTRLIDYDLLHLSALARGSEDDFVADAHGARLDLAHDDAAALQVAIQDRDTQRRIGVAVGDGQSIEKGQECRVRRVVGARRVHLFPPIALARGHFVEDVVAVEARDGQELHVALDNVAALLEVGLELTDALFVARAVPFDGRVVHLVHDHDEVLHAQRSREQRVFPSLSSALKTRLELSLTR